MQLTPFRLPRGGTGEVLSRRRRYYTPQGYFALQRVYARHAGETLGHRWGAFIISSYRLQQEYPAVYDAYLGAEFNLARFRTRHEALDALRTLVESAGEPCS